MTTEKIIVISGCLVLFADVAAQFFKAFTTDASFGFGVVAVMLIIGGSFISQVNDL